MGLIRSYWFRLCRVRGLKVQNITPVRVVDDLEWRFSMKLIKKEKSGKKENVG